MIVYENVSFFLFIRFGIGSILSGVMNEEDRGDLDSDGNSSSSAEERTNKHDDNPDRFDDTDFTKKEDSAVDYSDINELADESPPGSERQSNESAKDGPSAKDCEFEMDLEDAIPANKLVGDRLHQETQSGNAVGRSSDDGATTDDKELMPPPPPLKLQ